MARLSCTCGPNEGCSDCPIVAKRHRASTRASIIYCDRAPYRVSESPEVVLAKCAETQNIAYGAPVSSFVRLTDMASGEPCAVWLNVRNISAIEQYDSASARRQR